MIPKSIDMQKLTEARPYDEAIFMLREEDGTVFMEQVPGTHSRKLLSRFIRQNLRQEKADLAEEVANWISRVYVSMDGKAYPLLLVFMSHEDQLHWSQKSSCTLPEAKSVIEMRSWLRYLHCPHLVLPEDRTEKDDAQRAFEAEVLLHRRQLLSMMNLH